MVCDIIDLSKIAASSGPLFFCFPVKF